MIITFRWISLLLLFMNMMVASSYQQYGRQGDPLLRDAPCPVDMDNITNHLSPPYSPGMPLFFQFKPPYNSVSWQIKVYVSSFAEETTVGASDSCSFVQQTSIISYTHQVIILNSEPWLVRNDNSTIIVQVVADDIFNIQACSISSPSSSSSSSLSSSSSSSNCNSICPNDCSRNGYCDIEKGRCVCDDTYYGGDCSQCPVCNGNNDKPPSMRSPLAHILVNIVVPVLLGVLAIFIGAICWASRRSRTTQSTNNNINNREQPSIPAAAADGQPYIPIPDKPE
eukprot:TRINITY_DN4026_c0_g1_i3.p1 TRINITY_DN4026_c0_g1~~TRINITY_DN4026_c0_g1_i3.p1  ORF type:complete len:282 (+),score=52.11 TRINITY_DN4026_c0_g1_i3:30-875(+)